MEAWGNIAPKRPSACTAPLLKKAAQMLRFSAASLSSAVLDAGLFTLFAQYAFPSTVGGVFAATAVARAASGCFNFSVNRNLVFQAGRGAARQAAGYFALFCMQMALSAALVCLLGLLPLPLTVNKLLADFALFLVGYQIQRRLIFRPDQTDREE